MNYARYLPVYYREMCGLEKDHPDVYSHFLQGGFGVQLSSDNPFGRIPVDQTTECTVNKDTQTPGGTTKFSLKSAAVSRYYLTAEYRRGFLTQMKKWIQNKAGTFSHVDLQATRIRTDELAVQAVLETLSSWTNPFVTNVDLMNIATGTGAPEEVARDVMSALEKGEAAYATFQAERLESSSPKKKFHDPLKKLYLKTFDTGHKHKRVCSDGRTLILKADRGLFGRMIVMGKSRNMSMKVLLRHPFGSSSLGTGCTRWANEKDK